MDDMGYQLNELYKELTGKVCVKMDSDAVESMREAYQSNIKESINDALECNETQLNDIGDNFNYLIDNIQEDIIHYIYNTLLSDDAEAMEQPIIDIIDKLRG